MSLWGCPPSCGASPFFVCSPRVAVALLLSFLAADTSMRSSDRDDCVRVARDTGGASVREDGLHVMTGSTCAAAVPHRPHLDGVEE